MTWCAFTRFVSVLEILSVCSELTLFCVILCVSVCFWEEVVFPRSLSLILNISRQFIVDVSSPSRSMHAVGYPKPSICCTPIAYNNCTYVISQVTVQPINSFTPPAHMLIILSYFTVSGVLCIVQDRLQSYAQVLIYSVPFPYHFDRLPFLVKVFVRYAQYLVGVMYARRICSTPCYTLAIQMTNQSQNASI